MIGSVIPVDFARRIEEVHGAEGVRWLAELPDLVGSLCAQWHVDIEPSFVGLTYNWVAPGRRDGQRVVLKVGIPTAEALREPVALRAFAGRGAAKLLEVDSHTGAMLLERLDPGEMLIGHPSGAAIACRLLQELWQAQPGPGFPDLQEWTRSLEAPAAHRVVPDRTLERALAVRDDLLATACPSVLLHGDFHGFNILSSGSSWVAIDPKGVIGEPAFECGPFLLNDFAINDVERTRQDIGSFSRRLKIERERITAWAAVFGVLSTVWTFEDHGVLETAGLEFAAALDSTMAP